MNWHDLDPDHGVLELDLPIAGHHGFFRRNRPVCGKTLQFAERGISAASPPPLELLVYWGGGEPTRAVWLWRGAIAGWAAVGEA